MIRAIIFDCFDVLITNGLPPFVQHHFANNPEVQETVWRLDDAFSAGKMDYRSFLLKLSELANISLTEVEAELDNNQPDEALFKYIATDLKPEYKIGMLSNAGGDWVEEMLGQERAALFDATVLSFQVGMIKPQPEMYRLTAERLGMMPEECVFLDDKLRYCDGARAVGMQAVVYQNFAQAKRELDQLLADTKH